MDYEDPAIRNHIEICANEHLAGVSDRGILHDDNQDAFALALVEILASPIDIPPSYAAVLCDGVSSSASGASASAIAARTAMDSLKRALTLNPDADARKMLREAVRAANRAVYAIACAPDETDPPATTVVAVVVQERYATIAWLGDSRAYWISDSGADVLTRDHSWVNAMIDAGRMTEEEALQSPNKHALVRCLGGGTADEAESVEPSFATLRIPPGTRMILCSDGFWNYAPTPQNVARLVRHTPMDDPLATARHLINFANAQGGHDNITVAVLAL